MAYTFNNYQHSLGERVVLNETFEMVNDPPGLKTIKLYQHQRTLVKAMLDLEERRGVVIRDNTDYSSITADPLFLETSAMVLSAEFGTGKTIMVLAMILYKPIPRATPFHVNLCGINCHEMPIYRNRKQPVEFKLEINRRFIGDDVLLKPNLIVVGSSVLIQWQQAIENFTSLKIFMISDYYSLCKFKKIYDENKVNIYDIILLKNGNVTGNLNWMDSTTSYHSLISVIGEMTISKCWSRVIYDDFDTISIPADAHAINSLFTIYISATTRKQKFKPCSTALINRISTGHIPLINISYDHYLFTNFNLNNSNEFTEMSTRITIMECYKYVYSNPDDNCLRLLGAMSDEEASNVMEMLNGDAVGTAADALGIKSTSAIDIFQHILQKKYDSYMKNKQILAIIGKIKADILPTLGPHRKNKQHSAEKIRELEKIIVSKRIPPTEMFKFYSLTLERFISDQSEEYTYKVEQDGLALERVIDNVKEGECQICRLPLEGEGVFIIRCCGLIVCDVCGIKGNQLKHNGGKNKGIYGTCANCRAHIDPRCDLVFLDPGFDIESIISEKEKDIVVEEIEQEIVDITVKEIKNPKLKALSEIIVGAIPENQIVVNNNIPKLLRGKISIPQSDDIEKKILVFANYNETLGHIEDLLVDMNVKFLKLGGTYKEKAETVEKFKTYGQILLVNSQQNCAGLNIQFCTDIVLFHRINDENITGQVVGRGQRLGRSHNLKLHYLLYNNESSV